MLSKTKPLTPYHSSESWNPGTLAHECPNVFWIPFFNGMVNTFLLWGLASLHPSYSYFGQEC